MKILFITEFFPSEDKIFLGGVQTRTYYIAKYLSQKDEVTVITNKEDNKLLEELNGNLRVIKVGPIINRPYANSHSILKRFFFIFFAIKKGLELEFDLVEGTNFISHFSAFLIGFFKKKPKVAWYPDILIGSWIDSFGFLSGLVGEISERIILKLPWNKYIAISNSPADKLKKRGISNQKITVVNCGIDFEEFGSITLLKRNCFIISTVARLVSYKRIGDLILAFKRVKKKISQIKLQVIGDGPDLKQLENQVERLGIKKDVVFFKNLPREKFIKVLAKSSVFVLPSSIEGFGIAIIEAAALRIPYIVTDIPVLREITHNGEGGIFYNVGDIKKLAENLELILLNNRLRQKLAKKALKLAKNYQWNKIALETKKVYEEVSF